MDSTAADNEKTPQKKPIANVLVVDDDPQLARFMLEILAKKGIRGIVADSNRAAAGLLDRGKYDLVFVNNTIPERAGVPRRADAAFELLRRIRENLPEMPVIMMAEPSRENTTSPQEIADVAVQAVRSGCYHFLLKPPDQRKTENLLDTLLPNHAVRTCDAAEQGIYNLYTIVGKSEKLLQTVRLAKRVAPTSAPVLISGESGTGKELISCLIHHDSRRAQGPYIEVNCAALSDSLLESELFGHEKGAFTGAYTQRKGRFEMAHGGTLLLDEITETPPRFQAKLLRVLEQQDFERVGGTDNIKVDVRIISTTNKDLPQETAEGRFRQDLYYRLSALRLMIAPLRERTEDLPDLVWHFVNLYAPQVQRHITRLNPAMMGTFAEYRWPGNVRQLRNVVLTSMILGVGPTLSLANVSWLLDESEPPRQKSGPTIENDDFPNPDLGGVPLVQIEKRAILDTLRRTDGNRTEAAKVLGISDRTLRDRMRRYRQQECLQPV